MILNIVRKVLYTHNFLVMIAVGVNLLWPTYLITKSPADFELLKYILIPAGVIFLTAACSYFGLTKKNRFFLLMYIVSMSIFATATICLAVRVTDFAENGKKDVENFVDDKRFTPLVLLITYIYRWILKKVSQYFNTLIHYKLVDLNKPLKKAHNVEILMDIVTKTGYVLIGASIYELVGILSAIYVTYRYTRYYAAKKKLWKLETALRLIKAAKGDSTDDETNI